MKNLDNLFVATSYDLDESFDSEKFIKLRIRVCHDGKNPNNSNFTLENMDKAKDSILNTPILAYLYFDEEGNPQLGSHEMHLEVDKTDKDEIKMIYDEIPVGVVPESCNYEIKEFNGRNYVYVDAYIWKNYSNYVENVIQRDKEVNISMEIIVDNYSYNKEDNCFDITDYKYTAITLLGNDIGTGMVDAKAKMFSSDKEKQNKFNELKQELEKEINFQCKDSKEGGKDILKEKIELLKEFNLDKDSIDFSLEDISLEDLKNKLNKKYGEKTPEKKDEPILFSATMNQKREVLRNALDNNVVKDDQGNAIEETWYWVEDFDDKYVYVEKYHWTKDNGSDVNYGRFTYTFDNENMTAQITSEFEEMIKVWLTIEENKKLEEERNNYSTLLSDFENYKNTHSNPNEDFEKLQEFKNKALEEAFENSVNEVFEKFEKHLSKNEEFIELKDNYKDLTVEEIENKCFCITGKVATKFSSKQKQDTKESMVKLGVDFSKNEDETTDAYGGLLSRKYSK